MILMLKTNHRTISKDFMLKLVAFAVFGNGIVITLNSLASHLVLRRHLLDSRLQIDIGIIIGVTLIYLSGLLGRRKQTAWLVTMCIYAFIIGSNVTLLLVERPIGLLDWMSAVRTLVLPLSVVAALFVNAKEFTVKSDIQNFALVLRRVVAVLGMALAYGVVGFILLERRDFHRELSLPQTIVYTIDQFGIFTREPLQAFTYRAKVFLDSLSLISGLSIGYTFLALFQPLRARLSDQSQARQHVETLLEHYRGSSEDFFKLWPHDKSYIFSHDGQAAVAYHSTKGVALAVGDPIGKPESQQGALRNFLAECRINDWLPACVHTQEVYSDMYKKHGFSVQKIGQEAVVNLDSFISEQLRDKYFRQIRNKFTKHGYVAEVLQPPHNPALVQRLQQISSEWLSRPGRSERGVLMGYFSAEYLDMTPVMVLRDQAGTIQAFINQVPSFDTPEANYDMLRFSNLAPSNSNDFLLINYIEYLHHQGFVRLNLGLCPLAGVGDNEHDEPGVLDNILRFVYTNGDRVYSFSGLHRFKSKYAPEWRDRYIAYQGGLRGLSRTTRALTKAMKR